MTILQRMLKVLAALFVLTSPYFGWSDASAQLDETWSLSVGGQTVRANTDGSFVVANIAAPDQFGLGGPGTRPDFLSDDFLHLSGTSLVGGVTRYVYSNPFRLSQGQTFFISDLIFSDDPPPYPRSIVVLVQNPVLTGQLGEHIQVTTIGTLNDGSTLDLTRQSSYTTYRTSNTAVATIDGDGLITSTGRGIALITAGNNGATAVARLAITTAQTTTVEGFVALPSGQTASGAAISIVGLPSQGTSGADGRFVLSNVPTDLVPTLVVVARLSAAGATLAGSSGPLVPLAGMTTDAGIIRLAAGFPNGGFETGNFTGFTAAGNAVVVSSLGFVTPPEGDFMAQISTDPQGTFGRITSQAVAVPAGTRRITFRYNFLTDELDEPSDFNDVFVARLIVPNGSPIELVRVSRDDMLAGRAPNLPAPPGFDGMTGFLTASADVSAFAGGVMTIEFCFNVQDVGDDSHTSTTLIDDLQWSSAP